MSRVVVISQPMFLPWIGLFEQVKVADHFVHYDDGSASASNKPTPFAPVSDSPFGVGAVAWGHEANPLIDDGCGVGWVLRAEY